MTRFSRLRDWLQRHRRVALILSAAFLIFEATRAFAIGELLLPRFSEDLNQQIAIMLSRPLWITVVTAVLAVIFFAVPMAGVVYAGIRIRRAIVPLLNKR